MCFGDISPTSFFADPKRGNNPRPMGTHMCRNYDKIKDWAVDRRIEHFSMQDKILGPGHELGFDDKYPDLGHSHGEEEHHHHIR
jgi:hypothetical protein